MCACVQGRCLQFLGNSGTLAMLPIRATLNKGVTMLDNETKANVQAFYSACSAFIRGSWTAKRGATVTKILKDKTTKVNPVFDIMIPQGQINGNAQVGTVALIAKAKGEVALFVLTEQVGEGHTAQGIAYTLWAGIPAVQ